MSRFALSVLALGLTAAAALAAAPARRAVCPVFRPILGALVRRSRVPVILPSFLPDWSGPKSLYAQFEPGEATRDRYDVELDRTPDCRSDMCLDSYFSGERITARTDAPDGHPVRLRGGRRAWLSSWNGYGVTDPTITWDRGSFRYVFALKGGGDDELLRTANSAVSVPGPPQTQPKE